MAAIIIVNLNRRFAVRIGQNLRHDQDAYEALTWTHAAADNNHVGIHTRQCNEPPLPEPSTADKTKDLSWETIDDRTDFCNLTQRKA